MERYNDTIELEVEFQKGNHILFATVSGLVYIEIDEECNPNDEQVYNIKMESFTLQKDEVDCNCCTTKLLSSVIFEENIEEVKQLLIDKCYSINS